MTAPFTYRWIMDELDYNPFMGQLVRRIARCNRVKIGDVAGTLDSHGHRQLRLLGKLYLSARVIWFWMTGEWPEGHEVEHRDLDGSNDKWTNLRLATRAQNMANRRAKAGDKNITPRKGGYRLRMTIEGERVHIGDYSSVEEAQANYSILASLHHGEFARTV